MIAKKNKKQQLLDEGTVRKFMKLANIGSLTDSFLKERKDIDEEKQEEMDEVKTKEQSRSGAAPDRLDEMPEEMPPSSVDSAPLSPMDTEAPQDDQAVSEPMIQDLVKAIADAIQAQTGVGIDVEGSESSGSDEQELASDEMQQEVAPPAPTFATQPGVPSLSESGRNTPPAPPKTMPATPGEVKKTSRENVEGAETPTKMEGAPKDHKMKPLEEKLVRRVLERLLSELKSSKAKSK